MNYINLSLDCSYILGGLISILDAKLMPIVNSINSLSDEVQSYRNEMEKWKADVTNEIEFLGNVAWSIERKLERMENGNVLASQNWVTATTSTLTADSTNSSDVHTDLSSSVITIFPLEGTKDLESFETELQNPSNFQKWYDYCREKIKFKKTLYARRKALKELMFTE